MRKLRKLIERYERILMLGLVVVILVIFTVTGEIMDFLSPSRGGQLDFNSVAGSFSVLPGEKVEVSYARYDTARMDLERATMIFNWGRARKIKASEVWTHLLLLEAARREGISVSNSELAEYLGTRIPPQIFNDRPKYKQWIRDMFRVSPRRFEESIRDVLISARMRDLYRLSFETAPPATREELVKQYAGQNIEFVRASWLALDARHFIDKAEMQLKAEEKPEEVLASFFSTDAGVSADPFKFRHPRRYEVEFIYTIHKNLTEENYARIEALFHKTWPDKPLSALEQKVGPMKEYFGIYRDRLLTDAGTSWEQVQKDEKEATGGEQEKAGDENAPGDEEKGDAEADEKEADELEPAPTQEQKEAWFQRGYDVVKHQIARELKLRGMFWSMRDEAAKNEKQSLKAVFDKLRENDDPENPVCATEPGKGVVVFRSFDHPLSRDEIQDLEDSGVRFTHNVVFRVTGLASEELPKVGAKADVLGEAGNGRMIFRVIKLEQERRKSYEELTESEKEDLRKEFYLPDIARKRAREALVALREKCLSGDLTVDQLADMAAKPAGNYRFHGDEWLLASREFMTEPARNLYWKDEYRHMRDRHFLRRDLAEVLAQDRARDEKIKGGSWLEVRLDTRNDSEDPGAAYLVLVLERRRPDAESIPLEEFETYMDVFRSRRRSEDQERWNTEFPRLKQDFEMEFFGDMQKTIEEELKQREEARRKSALG